MSSPQFSSGIVEQAKRERTGDFHTRLCFAHSAIPEENEDYLWCSIRQEFILICYQVYRRDYEEGGIVLDPMKATHTVEVKFSSNKDIQLSTSFSGGLSVEE